MHNAALETGERSGEIASSAMPVLLQRLMVWVLCVLMFEMALIAIAPRYHSGSVLKLAKDCLLLRTGNDGSYYMAQADQVVRQSPNALYEVVFFQRGVRFIYPPAALLLYRFWLLGARWGIRPFWVMNAMLFLALWLTLVLAGQFFLDRARQQSAERWSQRDRWLARALIALLGLTFLPLVNAYCLGQMQTLINLSLVASALLWMRGRRIPPGVCVGLTCLLKPQASLFLLWGLLRRQWSFSISLCATLAAGMAISIAVFGWHNQIAYLQVVHYLSQRGDSFFANQSWNGLAHRLLQVGTVNPFVFATSPYPPYSAAIYWSTLASSLLLVLVALVVPYMQRAAGDVRDLLLFAMVTVMASPIAWEHHYGVFFLVFLAWMPLAFQTKKGFAGLLAVYLLVSSALAPLSPLLYTRWTFLISHVWMGGMVLFVMTLFQPGLLLPYHADAGGAQPGVPAQGV